MKTKNIFACVILIICILFVTNNFVSDKKNRELDKTTICKIYDQKRMISTVSGTKIKYYFYLNKNKINGEEKFSKFLEAGMLDKFFTVRYESGNPQNCAILLQNIVKDKDVILKAGFNISD